MEAALFVGDSIDGQGVNELELTLVLIRRQSSFPFAPI